MVEEKITQEIHGLISARKFEEAINKLQIHLKDEPENVALLLDLGYTYGTVNRFEDAIKIYEKVIEKTPDNETGYVGLGFIYKKKGDFEKAEAQFRKASEFREDNAAVYFEWGETLFELEKYEEAIKILHKAIQWGGEENDAQTMLLIAQCQLGIATDDSINEAIRIATKVLETKHVYVGAHLLLGTAFAMKKDWKAAIDNLEIYLKVDPDNEDVKSLLKEAQVNLK